MTPLTLSWGLPGNLSPASCGGFLNVALLLEGPDNHDGTFSGEERKEEAWKRGSQTAGKFLLCMTRGW